MNMVATVLVTLLGLAAWAGNGFERGMFIDFGSLQISDELKGRLNQELVEACPDLVSSQEAGPVAQVKSARVTWENGHVVYKIGLSFFERLPGPPTVANDRVVKIVLERSKTGFWFGPKILSVDGLCH